jgi:hypothetical protein
MSTWALISTHSTTWVLLSGGADDWADSRLTLLLTESGQPLLTESGNFLAIETVTPPTSTWVPA